MTTLIAPWHFTEREFRWVLGALKAEGSVMGPLPKTFLGRPVVIVGS